MKKIFYYTILLVAILTSMTACQDDGDYAPMTSEQKDLLGTAVNFNASIADAFTTRTSYKTDGSFNDNDMMVIYRQYSDDNGKTFDTSTEGYRVYSYQPKTVSGMSIALNTQWKVLAGKTGYEKEKDTFTQTDADSLTWDDGRTVRFRAWGLSNLSGCLSNGSKSNFYPDFTMAGWVTSSGPTHDIPLSLKHLACRIAVSPKSGNQLYKIELCTDVKDYMRKDNADSKEEDEKDICSEEEAQKRLDSVMTVYNKMCMPGGIDFETGLKAMSHEYWDNISNVKNIETEESQAKMISFDTQNSASLSKNAVHPEFRNNNGNQYFVTIPHDMSTEAAGEQLVLPYYTRFRVYLRDVNNGDKNTSGYEGTYHILALNDIKDNDTGKTKFPTGMPMAAGYSYNISVGYKYKSLSVTIDNDFSWVNQDLEQAEMEEQTSTSSEDYSWWKNAIDKSITSVLTSATSFNPEFEISTKAQFVAFMNLVNGTAAKMHTNEYTLKRGESYTEGTDVMNKKWKWYKVTGTGSDQKSVEISKEEAEADGFIFYHAYHPADGDNAAYYEEVVLDGPYSFYSNLVNRKFKVKLTADIDFGYVNMNSVGNSTTTSFLGIFDGQFHTLSNFYQQDGYLFGYVGQAHSDASSAGAGAVVSNLVINSAYPVCVVKEGYDAKILGISMLAPSYNSAFAEKLSGTSYVVGCANYGDATSGLVGEADNLTMYGCMQTAEGLTGGALLGKYSDDNNKFFAPATGTVTWGNFMCNFYDIDKSPKAHAVGSITDAYQRQQYIRASKTYMLCALSDQLITDRETLAAVKNTSRFAGFYGLAPWKAMNYAIYRYNSSATGQLYPCNAHYENQDATGYNHRYPVLKSEQPTTRTDWNVLEMLN